MIPVSDARSPSHPTPDASAAYAALVLRVSLGVMFLAHGLLKVFVFTLPGTMAFFESQGFPGWTAPVVTAMEIGGGLALIAGVATRFVSVALLPVLLGALWVHLPNGWLFSAPNGGWEYPAFLAAMLVVQFLLGDGAYALRGSRGVRSAAPAATGSA